MVTHNADSGRVTRILDDLFWLVTDSPISLDGKERDMVGHLRYVLDEWLDTLRRSEPWFDQDGKPF